MKDKQSGDWKDETDWHSIVLWSAEKLAEYLIKGKQVCVEGELRTRSWEKDGEKKYITEVVANNVVLCGSGESSRPAQQKPQQGWADVGEDDVPF